VLWKEIKTWAKNHGYESFREKVEGSDNQYEYYWAKIDDPSVTGLSLSAGKLATDIYNHMTDNKWLEYQKEYQENKTFHIASEN
jgi:hypothetical protein